MTKETWEVEITLSTEEILSVFSPPVFHKAHKLQPYMKTFTYCIRRKMLIHTHTDTHTQNRAPKSNCSESHCHRGNSGRLHAERTLSCLLCYFLFAPPTHTSAHTHQRAHTPNHRSAAVIPALISQVDHWAKHCRCESFRSQGRFLSFKSLKIALHLPCSLLHKVHLFSCHIFCCNRSELVVALCPVDVTWRLLRGL